MGSLQPARAQIPYVSPIWEPPHPLRTSPDRSPFPQTRRPGPLAGRTQQSRKQRVRVPLQVLHVAGQVGEQCLHLPAALGLQEEALVVARGWRERSLVRRGWSGPHQAFCPSAGLSPQVQAGGLPTSALVTSRPHSPPPSDLYLALALPDLAILFLSSAAPLHPGTTLPPLPHPRCQLTTGRSWPCSLRC